MKPIDNGPEPRKDLHIFYILDTSKSMAAQGKIEALNAAMKETLDILQAEAKKNADAKLHVAVLEFNSGANWITQHGPEALEEDFWSASARLPHCWLLKVLFTTAGADRELTA